MKLPLGYCAPHDTRVCKLQKSLYGLKQASRQWFNKLTSSLLSYGYVQSLADISLFTKVTSSTITILLVYVDDIILAGNSMTEIQAVKTFLHTEFTIKDLGELKYILGLEVARSSSGISVCQRKYVLDLLHDTGFSDCKPIHTPMDAKQRIGAEDGVALSNVQE